MSSSLTTFSHIAAFSLFEGATDMCVLGAHGIYQHINCGLMNGNELCIAITASIRSQEAIYHVETMSHKAKTNMCVSYYMGLQTQVGSSEKKFAIFVSEILDKFWLQNLITSLKVVRFTSFCWCKSFLMKKSFSRAIKQMKMNRISQ